MTTATSSASATQPAERWLAALLQCTDSAYPVGAFAHSFGLEGMVQAGAVTDIASLAEFLDGPVRHGLTHVDLPLLAHAWAAASRGDGDELARLDRLSAACRSPLELREASRRVGRQRLELLDRVWTGHHPLTGLDLPCVQAPVVAGIEAWALEFPKRCAMTAYAHGAHAAILSAALKLLRMGQTTVQTLLSERGRELSTMVTTSEEVCLEDIGSFAPWLDVSAMRHERSPARLFLS